MEKLTHDKHQSSIIKLEGFYQTCPSFHSSKEFFDKFPSLQKISAGLNLPS